MPIDLVPLGFPIVVLALALLARRWARRGWALRRWALGCLVAVLAGSAAVAWSYVPVVPDCDSLPMGPGDRCIVLEGGIGGGEGVYTYEESLENQRRSKPLARAVGWVLVAVGAGTYVVAALVRRRVVHQWRSGRRGPEAVARAVEAAALGHHVCSVALRGERTLHLHRDGIVVEHRQAVEDTVAWRDVDEVHEEKRTDADGQEWVHTCVLVADRRRVRLRAFPDDRSTLTAVGNLVAATRKG